jgi:hypothetical protein
MGAFLEGMRTHLIEASFGEFCDQVRAGASLDCHMANK